jgi:hypothetical protein
MRGDTFMPASFQRKGAKNAKDAKSFSFSAFLASFANLCAFALKRASHGHGAAKR